MLTMPVPHTPPLKNAASAPVIYFDCVPMYGVINGTVELEAAAQILTPKANGEVNGEWICTAHIRCSLAAAASLHDALGKALMMVTDSGSQLKS